MYPFIESIKLLNGVFYRMELHQARIQTVFQQFFPTSPVIDLQKFLSTQNIPSTGLYKCRLVFDKRVNLFEFIPYSPKTINSLKVVHADIEPCAYKSSNRSALDAAFALRGTADDVLILNRGEITDTWYANVALWNGHEWHTPQTPLIAGVQRADLLAKGLLIQKKITPDMLPNYQKLCIFNAMIEFGERVISMNEVISD